MTEEEIIKRIKELEVKLIESEDTLLKSAKELCNSSLIVLVLSTITIRLMKMTWPEMLIYGYIIFIPLSLFALYFIIDVIITTNKINRRRESRERYENDTNSELTRSGKATKKND